MGGDVHQAAMASGNTGEGLELSCGAKKEKECKKGEGQIARDRARESVCGGRRYPKVEGRSSAL